MCQINKIWSKIKNILNIKFPSTPVYDEKYTRAKVKEFNGVINKENVHYACIASTTIDSVNRMEKRCYPQSYLEECK